MVEPRSDPRSQNEYACGEAARRALWWRSIERGLEAFRKASGIHQSKTRTTAAVRNAAFRAPAVIEGTHLSASRRVHCPHLGGRAVPTRKGQGRAAESTPAPAQRARRDEDSQRVSR